MSEPLMQATGQTLTVPEETDRPPDVFISYSHHDKTWVCEVLLPQLKAAGLKAIDDRDFEIGTPKLVNMERAVENSRHTLVVLTTDWTESESAEFESLLVSTRDPAGRCRKLLPLWLKDCQLPSRIKALTPVDFRDVSRRSESMARLLKSFGKSANELVTQIVSNGLSALIDLMQTLAVREAVAHFRNVFEDVSQEIDQLNRYKILHDLFQKTEGVFNVVSQARELLLAAPDNWDNLEMNTQNLDAKMESMVSFAREAFSPAEIVWATRVEAAQADLGKAIQAQDTKRLNRAIERMGSDIAEVPHRLNECLVKIAQRLPLSRLVAKLETVKQQVLRVPLTGEAASRLDNFQRGIDALGRLDLVLSSLVSKHNYFQDLDRELRNLQTVQDIEDIKDSWKYLKPTCDALTSGAVSGPIRKLSQIGAEVDALIARDVTDSDDKVAREIRRRIGAFRAAVDVGFNQSDHNLRTFCGDLQKIEGSLGRAIERMEHE